MRINMLKEKIRAFFNSKVFINRIFNNFRNKRSNRRSSATEFNYTTLFVLPLFYLPKVAYLSDESTASTLEMKDILRGEYENKIRTFSSIEKRFLIFSKVKKFGDYQMTYYQYLDSLVPFQYIKTKSPEETIQVLSENKDFQNLMKKIDINGDGYINFEEYIIYSVFMSVPLKKYQREFPSGKLTREELSDFLMNEISTIDSLKITNKSRVDGRIIKTDYNTLYRLMVEFVSQAFNDTVVDINKEIAKFQFEVYLLMLFYEFYRIPLSAENKITIENFARVLMSYVNIYKNKQIKRKIEDKLINLDGEVSFDEYVSFFWFLKQLHNERTEVFIKGHLSLKDLKKLADEKMRSMPSGSVIKKKVSDKQLKLLIDLFDEDGKIIIYLSIGDGQLDFLEINDILKRRVFYSNSKSDFRQESSSVFAFFTKGYNFIKDNLWFLK